MWGIDPSEPLAHYYGFEHYLNSDIHGYLMDRSPSLFVTSICHAIRHIVDQFDDQHIINISAAC
jgi:hypothetical protein